MCTWTTGQTRLDAELICCSHCGSLDVYRRGSKDGIAHWRCRHCTAHWTEELTTGRGKECNAKLATLDEELGWTIGDSRVAAEVVCCPGCGCTKVRRSSLRSLIAYWYCDRCGQGWNEFRDVADSTACRVKRAIGEQLPATAAMAEAASNAA